jgi:hypothetical protein
MPNNDLISREKLQKVFERECIGECGCCKHIKHNPEGCALIDNAPAADAEPVRHAQWVTDDLGNTLCSDCKSRIPYYKEYDMDDDYGGEYDIEIAETNYCPNCGAKMDKEE